MEEIRGMREEGGSELVDREDEEAVIKSTKETVAELVRAMDEIDSDKDMSFMFISIRKNGNERGEGKNKESELEARIIGRQSPNLVKGFRMVLKKALSDLDKNMEKCVRRGEEDEFESLVGDFIKGVTENDRKNKGGENNGG